MSLHFGTGGWRALIGEEFTRVNVELLCRALAQQLQAACPDGAGAVIGWDRRFLSEQAARWAARTLAENGVSCLLLDAEAPTPEVMFAVDHFRLPCGLMVTASHNPPQYNGIKLFTAGGCDADEAFTGELEGRIAALEGQPAAPAAPFEQLLAEGRIRQVQVFNPYVDAILARLDTAAIAGAHLRVVLDPMFGVGAQALQTVLFTARCTADIIHGRHDAGFGGRLPAPGPDTLRSLQNTVAERRYDAGLALDGDADRLGVVDETGRYLPPDRVLAMLYDYLLRYRGERGAVVRNVATTRLLDAVAAGFGQPCLEVPVGFKYISAGMRSSGALLGGESSGGLTVRGHIRGKDGVFAAGLIVEMMAVTGLGLSQLDAALTQRYGRFCACEYALPLPEGIRQTMEQKFSGAVPLPDFGRPVQSVSRPDGFLVRFADGWVLCRPSGTEPLLRLFAELPDPAAARAAAGTLARFLGLGLPD